MSDEFEENFTVLDGVTKPLTAEESLKNLSAKRQRLLDIQTNLKRVLLALDHPSYVDRAAEFWGSQYSWAKTSVGLGLSFALLTVGLIIHVTILLILSVISALSYFAGGFVLDDHYYSNQRSKESLEECAVALTNMFGEVMEALDEVCNQLTQEVDRFQVENKNFKEQNEVLTGQVEKFTEENQRYLEENDKFSKGVVLLQKTNDLLNETLEKTQKQVVEVEKAYKEELQRVKSSMSLEIEKLIKVKDKLSETVSFLGTQLSSLSDLVITEEGQRQDFQRRLELMLQNSLPIRLSHNLCFPRDCRI